MTPFEPFVDIHCHLLPSIDDGADSWEHSLAMARMAAADGIGTVIATPHQLGAFGHNSGELIVTRTTELQQSLDSQRIPLQVLPGADVRIEPGLAEALHAGRVLTLGNHRKHVLLELPHELYFPLEEVLESLHRIGVVGVLSHPERNQGLLKQPHLIQPLVARGCLMQVTCGSLLGAFGPGPRQLAEWLLRERLAHFLATDAHSPTSRRPLMGRAFERVVELVGQDAAVDVCCRCPAAVAEGRAVPTIASPRRSRGFLAGLLRRGAA
jgi:protein-tyrosine phosphatase